MRHHPNWAIRAAGPLYLISAAVVLLALIWIFMARSQTPHDPAVAAEPGGAGQADPWEPTKPDGAEPDPTTTAREPPAAVDDESEARFRRLRHRMVDVQLAGRDITDRRVLEAMRRVPRHQFVPEVQRDNAYADGALPIGHAQTISQPYIVALMTQLVRPKRSARALDVGTGSGYQAAVLAELVDKVYSIEILCPLADEARDRLSELGYDNVDVRCGDGYRGWPEHAPFDVIILAAAPKHIPQPLVDQLARGGRLVLPVGGYFQNLTVIEKLADGSIRKQNVAPVAFVPMTGERSGARSDADVWALDSVTFMS